MKRVLTNHTWFCSGCHPVNLKKRLKCRFECSPAGVHPFMPSPHWLVIPTPTPPTPRPPHPTSLFCLTVSLLTLMQSRPARTFSPERDSGLTLLQQLFCVEFSVRRQSRSFCPAGQQPGLVVASRSLCHDLTTVSRQV